MSIEETKMPYSLTAEQSLLGGILCSPSAITSVADRVTAEDFFLTEHQEIFTACRELFLGNSEIDVVTLVDMLVTRGVYDKSGGESYLRQLVSSVPDSQNLLDYAKIVKEKSVLRQLITACNEISEEAYSQQTSVTDLLDHAQNLIFDIAQGRDTKSFRTIKDVLTDVYEHLHQLVTDKESTMGTPTGFSGLDRVLAGVNKTDLVLVGARPGMGKTSFALNIATNVAKQSKKKVCIFSLEMSAEQLVTRILSSEALVNSHSLRTGELNSDDWARLAQAATTLYGCDMLIDDTSGMTVTAMKAKLRRVQNLGLVVIDYLGLMTGDKHTDNRVQEVSEISRSLKIMAKELNVPILCCAQLSRGPESRTDKKPMLSDLRDSGAIEQDADTVLFLYRPDYYQNAEAGSQNLATAEVIIAKNRHGETGTVKMGWNGAYTKFITIDDTPGQ